ncbi:hypothetical protein CPC08DRAFT_766259 [Agrocybe pediades]|nr:hypothetical protein CPC08DRAFT_766259 [Agrocybe pediades]
MRSEDMLLRWDQALRAVIAYESRKYGKLTQAEYRTKHKASLRAYEKLKSDVPWFEVDWSYFSLRSTALSQFCTMLDKAANAARSEDIHSLREDVLHYIALTMPDERLEPHIPPRARKKDTRGFNHIRLARLLCPVSKLGEFDKAPEKYCEDLREGVITYLGFELPSCLWPHNGYDPDQTDADLFRSPVLLSVFKHIFTSPTSAVKNASEKPKTRHPQATINGMECVTAGSILYAAMMYRHAISSLDDWRDDEKVFIRSEFFKSMMNFFGHPFFCVRRCEHASNLRELP